MDRVDTVHTPAIEMECPISHELWVDPVLTPSGITYSREHICAWIDLRGTDPVTGEALTRSQLVPNLVARQLLEKLR